MCGADDRAELASSGAPQSGPRKGKGWWVTGFLTQSCCWSIVCCLTFLISSFTHSTDRHTVGASMCCYHVDSRSFFSLHSSPRATANANASATAPPRHTPFFRSGVQQMKLRRFGTAPNRSSHYKTVSGVQSIASSTICTTSDSPSQPNHDKMRCWKSRVTIT
jgi:hypothetical protein